MVMSRVNIGTPAPLSPPVLVVCRRLVAGMLPAQEGSAVVPASDFRLLAGCAGFPAVPISMTHSRPDTHIPLFLFLLHLTWVLPCCGRTLPGSSKARSVLGDAPESVDRGSFEGLCRGRAEAYLQAAVIKPARVLPGFRRLS